ncbi:hypothetical protein BGW80DRAFT_1313377 [Lactifluus volemus]|nr:hypothetical protein BGW80DRAFT_1313377 [Lactifluus volemus]
MDYDEMSFQQEPIPAECFYTRRAYNSLFGSVKPNVLENITCICGRPYNPDDSDPMHLCPRFGCKRWYHQSCLHENGFISTKSSDDRTKDFLDIPPARVPRVPPDLLRIACTPIVRGGPTHGVVGNVKTVCEAREWAQLYAGMPWAESRSGLLMNDITLDRWLDGLEGVEVEDLIYPDDESGSANFLARRRIQSEEAPPPFICPACEKPI